ncbi:hypothetical protein [Daejeonia sp. YH14]|uniref:hypothetical protein n=1 Tax=Daejeonia sp. YH14 TaxID=3439042 RepID=UPI003F4964F5
MEILINQKSVSLTDEYQIIVDNNPKFYAISEPLKKSAKINVYNLHDKKLIAKIAKQNFGIRANYLIQDLERNKIYSFEEINNIKLILKCQIGDDLFQLYGHNRNKYSIFKNQNQIAYWEKNNFILGEKDFYKIIANNDENPLNLASFCICVDNAKNNFQNELSLFNFDIGFKGNLLRKFDSEWKPK